MGQKINVSLVVPDGYRCLSLSLFLSRLRWKLREIKFLRYRKKNRCETGGLILITALPVVVTKSKNDDIILFLQSKI